MTQVIAKKQGYSGICWFETHYPPLILKDLPFTRSLVRSERKCKNKLDMLVSARAMANGMLAFKSMDLISG
jgi:hypothetical protein